MQHNIDSIQTALLTGKVTREAQDAFRAMARLSWAVRVICLASKDANHFSFPYPHRLGGFEIHETPWRGADARHHGDTAEWCIINAAIAAFPTLEAQVRAELGECP